MDEEIDVKEAADRIKQGAYLLDVRENDEWEHGHAPAAEHVALSTLIFDREVLPTDRQILVICKVGGRSAQATAVLRQSGFDAVNVAGGMMAWAQSGFPVTDSYGGEGTIV
jgi:rhodanese-related sulfurtransferase